MADSVAFKEKMSKVAATHGHPFGLDAQLVVKVLPI